MEKIRIDKKWIIFVYAIVACIAVYFNQDTIKILQQADITQNWKVLTDVIITVGMFLIVGISFGYAYKKLNIVEEIAKELKSAASSIHGAYDVRHTYLWEFYKRSEEEGLFKAGYLKEHYEDYCKEMSRLEDEIDVGYKWT